ncbi:hypothetical protein KP005_04980 [Geomonas nitrogeniifigens]|uniref:Uncharacterized protein n=1 Tax=Geomonas diazotrophica TaxID=2843197 RepID=A0ABX8JJT9_9BACT|nr:hypothetical protein [Geomonas nitrogeniifigens]QWV98644.1 hypothetical protein KP005_04980 [Geomonas nitrogeniifigens]
MDNDNTFTVLIVIILLVVVIGGLSFAQKNNKDNQDMRDRALYQQYIKDKTVPYQAPLYYEAGAAVYNDGHGNLPRR